MVRRSDLDILKAIVQDICNPTTTPREREFLLGTFNYYIDGLKTEETENEKD